MTDRITRNLASAYANNPSDHNAHAFAKMAMRLVTHIGEPEPCLEDADANLMQSMSDNDQLEAALLSVAPTPTSHLWSMLESPDVRGRARGVTVWLDMAIGNLPAGHPLCPSPYRVARDKFTRESILQRGPGPSKKEQIK